jgi:large subunit ribosomal protein L17
VPHRSHQRTLGREPDHRRAMLRNLTLAVLRYERVRTTEAKAKEVRRFVDRMIGLGRDGSLAARRRALAWLPEPEIVEKLFTDLARRYPERASGYARIVRIGRRVGDSAPMMLVELAPGTEEERPAQEAPPAAEERPRRRLGLPRGRRKAAGGAASGAAEGARKRTGGRERTRTGRGGRGA